MDALDAYLHQTSKRQKKAWKKKIALSGRKAINLFIPAFLDAPRELVWEVWTRSGTYYCNGGAPNGFTLKHNSSMDVSVGKQLEIYRCMEWGQDFDNKIHYLEVVRTIPRWSTGMVMIDDEISFMVRVTF